MQLVCLFRLKGPQGSIVDWADALVQEAGVLVLPASVYQHPPSLRNNHFRLGLGRSDFAVGMQALQAWALARM
jgi:aspartate/methionine/tyrosine aminotransferase